MMKMICSFLSYVYQKKLRLTFGVFYSFTKRIKIAFPFHLNIFYSYDHDLGVSIILAKSSNWQK